MSTLTECVEYVQTELASRANPDKAEGMQAYMKTDMPFYGVQKPGRKEIFRQIKKYFSPNDHHEYIATAAALWELPHREEKYLAQAVATGFPKFIIPKSLRLYRRFIVEGAWWDFVDETANHMIRKLVLDHPKEVWPIVDSWIHHQDMWLRRTAIICQIGLKENTDTDRLYRFCAEGMHEREFFIRKAIGWALREYAKTDPESVATFATDHREEMSGLSYREATKHIKHLVET